MKKTYEKEQYFEWLALPKEQRKPKSKREFARKIGVQYITLMAWQRGKDLQPKDKGGYSDITKQTALTKQIGDLPVEEQIQVFDKLLFSIARNPNASSKDRELFAKRYGLLVEKKEMKVGISLNADQIAQQHIENQRWLREHGYLEVAGVGQVQPEPGLLPEEIWDDK